MTPVITAFERSPDRGRGLARDMRVRWALEEVGQPYDVRLVSFRLMKEPAHRALHPFGQIPAYEEGGLALCVRMSPAAKHGRRTSVPSPTSWRCSPMGQEQGTSRRSHEQHGRTRHDGTSYSSRKPPR